MNISDGRPQASPLDVSGALLFGRYAFPPNRLGYCGPSDHQALLEYVATQAPDWGLVELERRFEGAYPYLALIAQTNHIADPLDRRVVEAYWLGNHYLEQVDAASFYTSLDERFRRRMSQGEFAWLAHKLALGAVPHHNFHVFEVYTRAGLMNDAHAHVTLDVMDSCRISWGRVLTTTPAELIVERRPLQFQQGKLALGQTIATPVARQINGQGFADEATPGDIVTIHWNWACEVIGPRALTRLQRLTQRALALANQTM